MSKISERRERTANTQIDNKAYLAEAPAKKKEYIYKKILIAVLAVVAVVACVLLLINAVVDAQAKKFVNAPEHSTAVATTSATGAFYEKTDEMLAIVPEYREAYLKVINNMSRPEVVNAKSDENVYNFVVSINSDMNTNSGNLTIALLLSFDKAEDNVTYIHINKSALAYIPTVGVGPLFDAYAFGGGALLARAVEENYGIAINGYVDLSLDSFVAASAEVGGITINDTAYETKQEIYDYVDKAEDREAAIKNVVTALANGVKQEKLFGASKIVLKVVETAKANISRDDVGELLQMGVGVFKNEPVIATLGYDTAEMIYRTWYPELDYRGIFYSTYTFDYEGEITAIQNLLYRAADAE